MGVDGPRPGSTLCSKLRQTQYADARVSAGLPGALRVVSVRDLPRCAAGGAPSRRLLWPINRADALTTSATGPGTVGTSARAGAILATRGGSGTGGGTPD